MNTGEVTAGLHNHTGYKTHLLDLELSRQKGDQGEKR
jgi:hypothetical protein